MAWFIARDSASLAVQVAPGRWVVFKAAEYRTTDPVEIAALRADPRVGEAFPKAPRPAVRPWAVNLETRTLHDMRRSGTQCHVPSEVLEAGQAEVGEAPAGWKVYRRASDARRWNRGVEVCIYCSR